MNYERRARRRKCAIGQVVFPLGLKSDIPILTADASLDVLDAGEREAILLAQELSADLLLVDDKQARQAALDLHLSITGTIGVLDQAARRNLIDLRNVIDELQKTNFHISEDLIRELFKADEN